MRKLKTFTPPKPVAEPFGPGSGSAHTFCLGRDGVKAIIETKEGNVIVVQEKADTKTLSGFLHLSGGGHGRLEDEEIERVLPREKTA